MTQLVTIEQAKDQLRIVHTHDDPYLVVLIESASRIITQYLKVDDAYYETAIGSPEAIPAIEEDVELATLLVVDNLYNRETEDPITPAVQSILRRRRDPALA